jgi:3-deoxy-D-manno-octulosonic-acid transferase
MTTVNLFFYNIFLKLYTAGIYIVSLWNNKALLWIKGRKDIFKTIEYSLLTTHSSQLTIWMHCASLGEFEQGRPVIEKIKKEYPAYNIILTFFSPSGYEIEKNYQGVDHVFYLPMDSASNAKKFIDLIDPKLVLWVKYEYWYYYLTELKKKNIPTLLISGSFREGQPFFRLYGKFWRKMLDCFTYYFLQNEDSKDLLATVGIKNVTVSGDTRFDRVIAIAENFDDIPLIKEFCKNSKVIVAGSTWEDDEAELTHYAKTNTDIKFIIAPHEIDKENLRFVKKEFKGSIFYSELNDMNIENTNTIIIDNIGMLSRLYKYA